MRGFDSPDRLKMAESEWWYETPWGQDRLILYIDEDSPKEDIEAEIEYWSDELATYDPPEPHRKQILKAIRWMTGLLGD